MLRKAQKISEKILDFVPPDIRPELRPILNRLGTEIFPIGQNTSLTLPRKVHWTLQSEVEDFVNFLDEIGKLKLGRCINNAKEMMSLAQFGPRPVMHRGWVIYYENGNCFIDFHCWVLASGIVVDPSFDVAFAKLMRSEAASSIDEAVEKYRASTVRMPLSKRCVIGSIPDGLIYVGQPTDFDEASAYFSYWFHKIAKPYGLRGSRDEFERSLLQEKIEND